MSVRACCRNNCDNIMCDRANDEHGYICDECLTELIISGSKTSIKEFMDSKRPSPREREAYKKFFNTLFKDIGI
jgi:hypothetical protein